MYFLGSDEALLALNTMHCIHAGNFSWVAPCYRVIWCMVSTRDTTPTTVTCTLLRYHMYRAWKYVYSTVIFHNHIIRYFAHLKYAKFLIKIKVICMFLFLAHCDQTICVIKELWKPEDFRVYISASYWYFCACHGCLRIHDTIIPIHNVRIYMEIS